MKRLLFAAGFVVTSASLAVVGACSSSKVDSSSGEKSVGSEASSTTVADGSTASRSRATLAATPPMGWNSWNQVRCHDLNEDVVKQAADAMVSHGLDKLGYDYIVVDDCWQAPERDANGSLQPDPQRFPGGMKALGDYIHSKGLKYGLYLVPGSKTCAMIWDDYPATGLGSHGHERQDAEMLQSFGVDYLKYDWCSADENDGLDKKQAFKLMHDELLRLDRPMVYSISEYGDDQPWLWAPEFANMWRTTADIAPFWPSIAAIIENQAELYPYAGPGHWNDPDMLQVGNGGLNPEEIRTHVGMWAMLAAPLMIGTDMNNLAPDVLAAISNPEIIEIDQDPLGKQAKRVNVGEGDVWSRQEVWARPLKDDGVAVALFNKAESPVEVQTTLEQVGASAGSWKVRDAWSQMDLAPTEGPISATVPAHGTVILRLTKG